MTPPMILGAWLHDLSPFAVRLAPGYGVRWYGLAYIGGFLIGWALLRRLAHRGATLIPAQRVADVMLLAVAGVVVGGRLGYVLFYQPSLLWSFYPRLPWWGVLAINEGGMASHGGMIGVILAMWIASRGFKNESGRRVGRMPFLHVVDVMALLTPFGLLLGRLANFVNGELLGRIVARPGRPAPWWSVKFPHEVPAMIPAGRSPAQELQLAALLEDQRPAGGTLEHARHLLVEAVQRGAPDVVSRAEPLLAARHPSQLYQAAAEGIALGAVLWFIARRARLPGVVGAWFLIVYGVLRVATEFWRLPDAHLEVQRIAGLSRGQWLSAAMVVAGAAGLWFILRRGGSKIGGWLAVPEPPGIAPGRERSA